MEAFRDRVEDHHDLGQNLRSHHAHRIGHDTARFETRAGSFPRVAPWSTFLLSPEE